MSTDRDPALEVIRHFKSQLPAGRPIYAAIGVFDGVHLGHQELLHRVVWEAEADGAVSCALTFQPHPLAVVNGGINAPPLLTSLADRLFLLGQTGIQRVLVIPFTPWFARLAPEIFVQDILFEQLGIRRVYVGFSFTFGRFGRGTPALLRQLGAGLGMEVVECPPVYRAEKVISSTQIRQALLTGDVKRAALSLGRPHVVEGIVQKGDARGRQLGFPTANIPASGPIMWPADGVYAVKVCLRSGQTLGGVANLGRRPTIAHDGRRLLEVHLFDFQGDLYGQKMRIAFLEFIRGERRFSGLEELKQQIKSDVDRAVGIINALPAGAWERYLCLGREYRHIYSR